MNIGHDYIDQDICSSSSNSEYEDIIYEGKNVNKFALPSINSLWNNKTNNNGNDDESLDETNQLAPIHTRTQDFYNTRKEQLQTFINDLSNGFSLNFAITRFSYLRSTSSSKILPSWNNFLSGNGKEETLKEDDLEEDKIENNKEILAEDDEKNLVEPSGVDPVVQPPIAPLIDDVVYPKTVKFKKKKKKKHSRKDVPNQQNVSESDSSYHPSGTETDEDFLDTLNLFNNYEVYINLDHEEYKHPDLLRKRIIAITKIPDLSDKHKGQLVQKLMFGRMRVNNGFNNANDSSVIKNEVKILSKDINDQLSEDEDADVDSNDDQDEDSEEGEEEEEEEEIDDGFKNLEYLPKTQRSTYHDIDEEIYGCPHYQTSCKLQCPTCSKFYTCRNCHDANETNHVMSRKDVNTISCMNCGKIQPPAQECIECDEVFAEYFCSKCKLYDNDPNKNIYHCEECGICRLGLGLGIDYYHCHGCNACISILLEKDHKCIENRTKCDCPICHDFMFTSKKKVVVMPCGHAIHQHCYDEYVLNYYKCPICSRTIINMEARFREIDAEIELQPMPEPYSDWKCLIICNDCSTKSICNYHILGLKCEICRSYNTAQIKLIKDNESDNDELFEDNNDENINEMEKNKILYQKSQNDLLKSFFNDTSEYNTDGEDISIYNNKSSTSKKEKPTKRSKRGDSVSSHRKRSSTITKEKKNPVINSAFATNIRNMINSATSSTNNYYNEFIQSALDSLNDNYEEDYESFKEGDLFTFNKNKFNQNSFNFFNKKDELNGDEDDAKETDKVIEDEIEENNKPSLGEVLRKWANSTAGISDSEEEEETKYEVIIEKNDDNDLVMQENIAS